MTSLDQYPSYLSCVSKALSESRHPLDIDELVSAVANLRPVGKAAKGAVYRALDKLYQAVPVDEGRFGWLSQLLTDNVVCHPLTSEEISHGHLLLDELEHSVFFPQFFQHFQPEDRTLSISLFGGPTIDAIAAIEDKTWSLQLGHAFVTWLDRLGVENRDDIIIKVIDAKQGRYEFRTRLREMRDQGEIQQRNIRLALLAEEIAAEEHEQSYVPSRDLVARLIGRGCFRDSLPADDLHYVLHEFSMLHYTDGKGYRFSSGESAGGDLTAPDQGYTIEEARDILTDLLAEWQEREDNSKADVAGPIPPAADAEPDWFSESAHATDQDEQQCCSDFEKYLSLYSDELNYDNPLNHREYHLLEAELESLIQLEAKFGALLPEQQARIDILVMRLSIDPESPETLDWDSSDDSAFEDPPTWNN